MTDLITIIIIISPIKIILVVIIIVIIIICYYLHYRHYLLYRLIENIIRFQLILDFNNNYDTNKKNEIFNCKSKPDKFFAFSLNNFKNYYLNNKNGNYTPCFSIYFDPNRESFYGKEKKNSSGQYLLTGKEEFNILEFEVYEIDV